MGTKWVRLVGPTSDTYTATIIYTLYRLPMGIPHLLFNIISDILMMTENKYYYLQFVSVKMSTDSNSRYTLYVNFNVY